MILRACAPSLPPPTPGLWLGLGAESTGGGGAGGRAHLRKSCLGGRAHTQKLYSLLPQVGGGHFLADPLPGEPVKAAADPSAARTQGTIPVTVTYTVSPDGGVRADWGIDASDALPAPLPWGFKSLPRVGVHLALAGGADPPVAWYGAGPHEAYPDRKDSAPVRAHAVPKASDLHVPYIFPGECGGRAQVRWLAVGRVGLASLGDAPLQANISRFPLATFSGAGHDEELVADGAVHVHLDAGHMGVGGDDSWSPAVWEVRDKKWRRERALFSPRTTRSLSHTSFLHRNTRSSPRRTTCPSCWCRLTMARGRRLRRQLAGWRGVENG